MASDASIELRANLRRLVIHAFSSSSSIYLY